MKELQELNDLYIENDKWNAPFLLAASFHNLVTFVGSHLDNSTLYWHFSPKDKAELLIRQFRTKTNPSIPARDLFEAIETFWEQVASARKGGRRA